MAWSVVHKEYLAQSKCFRKTYKKYGSSNVVLIRNMQMAAILEIT